MEFIGKVELRNHHLVYYQEDSYRVEKVNPKKKEQETHYYDIPDKVVEYLYNEFKGRKVTTKDASTVLQPVANKLNLPYSYGDQLGYYAQEVLAVIVVLGKASLSQEGRAFFYTIS